MSVTVTIRATGDVEELAFRNAIEHGLASFKRALEKKGLQISPVSEPFLERSTVETRPFVLLHGTVPSSPETYTYVSVGWDFILTKEEEP